MKIKKEVVVDIDVKKLGAHLDALRVPSDTTFILSTANAGRFEFSSEEWNLVIDAAKLGLAIMEKNGVTA